MPLLACLELVPDWIPNPELAISREMTLSAAWADVNASVLWLSRCRTLNERDNSTDTMPSSISMIVIAIISSISEKPLFDDIRLIC